MRKLRIFNASPGDVAEERQALSEIVIPELRRIFGTIATIGNGREIELEAIRWETHSWPDVGADAQDVINRQLTDFDIFIGIMWKRFGTPTRRSGSGTGEEFDRAYHLYMTHKVPRIMFYFRTTSFYPHSLEDIDQIRRVFDFKQRLESLGVRYWQYDQPIEFERFVREHLVRQIFDIIYSSPTVAEGTEEPGQSPRTGTPSVFISYTPQDRDAARHLAWDLDDAGIRTWLDIHNLVPGQKWKQEIEKAIKSSNVFLVLLSKDSVSKEGYIQNEIQFAISELEKRPERQAYIVPIRLEDCEVPDPLAMFQWIDMFRGWDEGLAAIIRALEILET